MVLGLLYNYFVCLPQCLEFLNFPLSYYHHLKTGKIHMKISVVLV